MCGKANCDDESAVESFFKSLKAELVWHRNWQTRRKVEIALFFSYGLTSNHCRATEHINGFLQLTPQTRSNRLEIPRDFRKAARLMSAPDRTATSAPLSIAANTDLLHPTQRELGMPRYPMVRMSRATDCKRLNAANLCA
jgi:hypothetical protein